MFFSGLNCPFDIYFLVILAKILKCDTKPEGMLWSRPNKWQKISEGMDALTN